MKKLLAIDGLMGIRSNMSMGTNNSNKESVMNDVNKMLEGMRVEMNGECAAETNAAPRAEMSADVATGKVVEVSTGMNRTAKNDSMLDRITRMGLMIMVPAMCAAVAMACILGFMFEVMVAVEIAKKVLGGA